MRFQNSFYSVLTDVHLKKTLLLIKFTMRRKTRKITDYSASIILVTSAYVQFSTEHFNRAVCKGTHSIINKGYHNYGRGKIIKPPLRKMTG